VGTAVHSLRSTELGNAAHAVIERAWARETHVHNDFVPGTRALAVQPR